MPNESTANYEWGISDWESIRAQAAGMIEDFVIP
jgi:hypothetical protein